MPELTKESLADQVAACEAGQLPPRYARNGTLTTPAQQARLLRGRVLLVGLGGLGGHVLDMLLRLGVGHILGADGDSFEASNLNRQLLCTLDSVGSSKAAAAADYARRVNPAVDFVPLAEFLTGEALHALLHKGCPWGSFDLVVDALGGLKDRGALQKAAQAAGLPLVTAGIAGLTGWVQVLRPGDKGPMDFFSQKPAPGDSPSPGSALPISPEIQETLLPEEGLSAEALLGNLAPTVALAASLQCAEVYALLTRGTCRENMLIFDLEDQYFNTLRSATQRKAEIQP